MNSLKSTTTTITTTTTTTNGQCVVQAYCC